MKLGNLQQKATPWVSFAVLAGGLVSALLLAFVEHVQSDQIFAVDTDPFNNTAIVHHSPTEDRPLE